MGGSGGHCQRGAAGRYSPATHHSFSRDGDLAGYVLLYLWGVVICTPLYSVVVAGTKDEPRYHNGGENETGNRCRLQNCVNEGNLVWRVHSKITRNRLT